MAVSDAETSAQQLAFRKIAGLFATGVTVVTTRAGDKVHGMTANSFTSLSLSPMLVLICVELKANMHSLLEESGIFAVNVLSERQAEISKHFASKNRTLFYGEFDGIRHDSAETGAPVILGSLCWLDCKVVGRFPGGDHTIFIGEVASFGADDSEEPLIFYRGRYGAVQK